MITFTVGLFFTFLIGYWVIKGMISMIGGVFKGIANLFKKGE